MNVAIQFFSEGEHHYRVLGIPSESRFIRMDVDYLGRAQILIEHKSFDEVIEGQDIPQIYPMFEKLYVSEQDVVDTKPIRKKKKHGRNRRSR